MEDKVKLTIEIKNQQPIELIDLAQSMLSFGAEYQNYLARNASHVSADGARLYVKDVRSGSVITELVALAPYALPLVEHADTVLEYGKFIVGALAWLCGRGDKPDAALDKNTLQNLGSIVEPIAKDRASQFNLSGTTITGDVNFNITINSTEANAAQNMIRREVAAMKEPISGVHSNVVMYWAQARNQAQGKSGDRAKIESLFKGDVKVIFANNELKGKMLYDPPYPFKKAFLVDVAVETVEGKPALYKVLNLHEILDREDDDATVVLPSRD